MVVLHAYTPLLLDFSVKISTRRLGDFLFANFDVLNLAAILIAKSSFKTTSANSLKIASASKNARIQFTEDIVTLLLSDFMETSRIDYFTNHSHKN